MDAHDNDKQQEQKQQAELNSPAQTSAQVAELVENEDDFKNGEAAAEDDIHSDISSLDPETVLEVESPVDEMIDSPQGAQQQQANVRLIRLEGTHMTSTETENVQGKHVNFESEITVVGSSSSDDSKATVREIMEQIIHPTNANCIFSYGELRTMAKKRQQNEMTDPTSIVKVKRMRSEEPFISKVYKKVPVPEPLICTGSTSGVSGEVKASECEPNKATNSIVENVQAVPNVIVIPNIPKNVNEISIEIPSNPIASEVERLYGNATVTNQQLAPSAANGSLVSGEKPEVSDRFKQIMEMFDNFTRNLEHLDVEPEEKSPRSSSKKHTPSKHIQLPSPHVHMSRYADFLQKKMEAKKRADMEKASSSSSEQTVSSNNVCAETCLHINEVKLEPERRHISTTTSFLELQCAKTVTIECQTSGHQNFDYSLHPANASVSATRLQARNTPNSTVTEVKLNILELSGTTDGNGTNVSTNKTNSDVSDFTLAKVSEPPSEIELAPLINAPCERTFHTIHIESAASPTASVMERPPLCTRLWTVVTDFCAAICLCLQVNKDCIFCLGFFLAFVVSASFLTAFFYRTLSVNPELFHPQNQRFNDHHAVMTSKDSFYI